MQVEGMSSMLPLTNSQVWEQATYDYEYHYAYQPGADRSIQCGWMDHAGGRHELDGTCAPSWITRTTRLTRTPDRHDQQRRNPTHESRLLALVGHWHVADLLVLDQS